MTPVGWLISAALIVIAGIAYAATLLNVPVPAIAVGVIAALVAVFMLVTRRGRELRVPTLHEPTPDDQTAGDSPRPAPELREPAPGDLSAGGRAPRETAPLPEHDRPRPDQSRSDHESHG
ncbi:MAG TPA: hypothetical protein VFG84_03675 [Gemmatimonadaceae bacterium]|nr:hypothetical protein [Gemmatimonadaceae bacterium]